MHFLKIATLLLFCVFTVLACDIAQATILMDSTTNNGSFNNPAPAGYTVWNTASQQVGWTASPFNPNDPNRQWSDAANTPKVLPSGNPTVSGPGSPVPGYPLGSSFTSDPIGTLANNTTYDLSGWSGYAYGNGASIPRSLQLIAKNGSTETVLTSVQWLVESSGDFSLKAGSYTSAVSDPLAGQNLIVRANIEGTIGGAFGSFGDIAVEATLVPEPASICLIVMGASTGLAYTLRRRGR